MRNLKKILAMVLALVMSLSLMATAGAADFTDASSINEKYETAIEVLEGLGVFKGYQDGTFQPQGSITRAETAAIIYRIVTGDVKDEQVGIYADYNLFTDVPSTSWFAGYVNYCANAEYIKGVGGGKFNPNAQVTGYAALAMILRAIGYTANGGFTGSDWEVQTARTAESRKITKNIMTGTLGQNANRETVAEILFQAILVNMVDHNILNTNNGNQGYTEIDETLGYKTFKLEQIEGVVTGNEFADLKSTQVLDKGQTQLQTEDSLRDLAISTRITDVGESRYAYITGSKVLAMGDTGLNKVTEFGHASDITTTAKFNATAEMPAASNIEYYIDFGRVGSYTCDQRIEFVVTFNTAGTGRTLTELVEDFEDEYVRWDATTGNDLVASVGMTVVAGTDPVGNPASTTVTYSKIIRAENDISDQDLDVIRGIFAAADNNNVAGTAYEGIEGDVFVGTFSSNIADTEERDLSNKISYKKFVEEYINDEIFDANWNQSYNGDWVKFVDNNGDGKAEYAFRTTSWLDEAIDTYTNKDGDTVTQFIRFNDDDTYIENGWSWTVRYLDNDGNDTDKIPAVGEKVVCSLIDNQVLVEPAVDETVTVTDYSWKDDIITTDKGEYGQSFIGNATQMQERISTMADNTEYKVYFDHFGYVRAYELPGGTQYALVTEIYARNNANGNLQQSWPMTAELVVKDANAAEYNLSGGTRSPFVSAYAWGDIYNYAAVGNYHNYLQPATAHYGVSTTGFAPVLSVPSFGDEQYTFWSRNKQLANDIDSMTAGDVFEYGSYVFDETAWKANAANGISEKTVSFTNVAVTNINDDTVTLTGAAQLRRDKAGNILLWNDGARDHARYAVDYVELTKDNVVSGQTRYNISADYTGWQGNAGNNYVSATHNTEYYIVYNGGVYYFTDYVNMPALTADNNIRAAYAVARDTSADNANQPYWVADVIVYEVENWDDSAKTSTALVYYNPSRNDQQVQLLEVLDNKNDPAMVNVIPNPLSWSADAWRNDFGPQYAGYGFYQLWDGEKRESGELAVSDIIYIDGINHTGHTSNTTHADGSRCGTPGADLRWNSNLVYAGTVINEVEVGVNGTYLNVDTDGDGDTNVSLRINDSANSNVYSITTDRNLGSSWNYNEADTLRYNNVQSSGIKAGDRIVWVGNSAINVGGWNNTQSAAFVVDLGNQNSNYAMWLNTAQFLAQYPVNNTTDLDPDVGLWLDILNEQTPAPTAKEKFNFNLVLGSWETAEVSVNGSFVKTVEGGRNGNAPAGELVDIDVPTAADKPNYAFTLSIKVSPATADIGAVVVNAPWTATKTVVTEVTATSKTYTVMIGRGNTVLANAGPIEDAKNAQVRIYTVEGIDDLATWAKKVENINKLSDAEVEALAGILTALNTAVASNDALSDELKTAVGDAKTAVANKVTENESAAATALNEAKTAATAAANALAEGCTGIEAVDTALAALTCAIDACTSIEELAAYWTEGALVENDLVAAVKEAVTAAESAPNSLANQKKAAIKAVNDMTKPYDSDEDVAAAKQKLIAAIEACESVNADPSVPTALVLSTYWADDDGTMKIVVASGLGKELKDAIDAAADEAGAAAELQQAKTNAEYAVGELFTDKGLAVPKYNADATGTTAADEYSKLVKLIRACDTTTGGGTTDISTYFTANALVDSKLTALNAAIDKELTVTISDVVKATVDATPAYVTTTDGSSAVVMATYDGDREVTIKTSATESDWTDVGGQKSIEVTFKVTGGTAALKATADGVTLTPGTGGAYTLTVTAASATETSVVLVITQTAAQA